jgi:N-hydroxyarylamine O-acetyltransferase
VRDEWDVERLDLDAYLRRVDAGSDLAPTATTLARLHRAHVAAIPFENLDIPLGRGIAVDLDSVQDKLVRRRRGGYCHEHGLLFAAVLERLGFPVERRLARVGGDAERPRPRTHMTLDVRAGGRRWLADVGFGSGLLEPLPFDAGGPVAQGGWTFDLSPTGPGSWVLRELRADGWTPLYGFDEQPQHAADVVVANWYTSTNPDSPFVGQLVVMRRDEDAVRRLVDRRLTVIRPGRLAEERRLGDRDLAEALRDDFRLSLDPAELATVPGSLPPLDQGLVSRSGP